MISSTLILPISQLARLPTFTSYTNRDFNFEDLKRLADLCNDLDSKGCKVILSNSNTSEVKSMFDKSWKIKKIEVNRAINSDSKKRTGHSELVYKKLLSFERDPDPRPLPYQGNALPG